MTIELNRRDLELLLLIMDDVEEAALESSGKSPYAMEELMLYDKIEKALTMLEAHDTMHTLTTSELTH